MRSYCLHQHATGNVRCSNSYSHRLRRAVELFPPAGIGVAREVVHTRLEVDHMKMCVQDPTNRRADTFAISHRQTVPKTRPVAFLE